MKEDDAVVEVILIKIKRWVYIKIPPGPDPALTCCESG